MPKVWIPKSAGHAFGEAENYGTLQFIFDDSTEIFNPERLGELAKERLRDWSPEDWLLLSGPALMNGIVFAVVAKKAREHQKAPVKLLLFHSKTDRYLERVWNG